MAIELNHVTSRGFRTIRSMDFEPRLRDHDEATPRVIHNLLRKLIVHQFHNTSMTAKVRTRRAVTDGSWLKEDAAHPGA